MKTNLSRMRAEIGADYISILYDDGDEIAHWIEDEWIEDPSVTLAIARAIVLAYTRPDQLLAIVHGLKEHTS